MKSCSSLRDRAPQLVVSERWGPLKHHGIPLETEHTRRCSPQWTTGLWSGSWTTWGVRLGSVGGAGFLLLGLIGWLSVFGDPSFLSSPGPLIASSVLACPMYPYHTDRFQVTHHLLDADIVFTLYSSTTSFMIIPLLNRHSDFPSQP